MYELSELRPGCYIALQCKDQFKIKGKYQIHQVTFVDSEERRIHYITTYKYEEQASRLGLARSWHFTHYNLYDKRIIEDSPTNFNTNYYVIK
jgi:hypothetical protein